MTTSFAGEDPSSASAEPFLLGLESEEVAGGVAFLVPEGACSVASLEGEE